MIKSIFHLLKRALARSLFNKKKDVTVVGITGSYGKTNTSTAIAKILSKKFKTLQTDLNLDTNHNIPNTLLKLRDEKILVIEYGIDHIGEMENNLKLVRPKIGVLTGIAPVHTDQEHLGSLENVIQEKGRLLEALPSDGVAFINWDDGRAREMSEKTLAKVIFFGTDSKHCQIYATEPRVTLEGTEFKLHWEKKSVKVKTKLIGRHHLNNLSAAAGVALVLGMNLEEVAKAVEKIEPLEGRVSIEKGFNKTIWINDSRRANLASMLAGLQVLSDIKAKRKIAVLGEMREMGDYAEEGHREVGRFVAKIKPNYLVTIGNTTQWVSQVAKEKVDTYEAEDVFDAAEKLKDILKPGDLVYLKGSLLAHTERIPLILQGKKVDPDEIASKRYEIYR